MQKVRRHPLRLHHLGGEHPIPIMSTRSIRFQSRISPGLCVAQLLKFRFCVLTANSQRIIHSFPLFVAIHHGLDEEIPSFLERPVGGKKDRHVIQNTTLTQHPRKWEHETRTMHARSIKTSLTWISAPWNRHLGSMWEFHDQSLPSFGGLETPDPWCSRLRFR